MPRTPGYTTLRFTGARPYAVRIVAFLAIVAIAAVVLFDLLQAAFRANPALNGLIAFVFIVGVGYVFQQLYAIGPAASWLRRYARGEDPSRLGFPPGLIAPIVSLAQDRPDGGHRISATSARVILDSIGGRMAEAGEITRYVGRLLIFLGLLGTFWGLMRTVGSVGDAVAALTESTGGQEGVMAMMQTLRGPVEGMGTAFSSSLFGLAGSLVIGFLELQASQAQNRFYNEIEEWVATMTRVGSVAEALDTGAAPAIPMSAGAGAAAPAYMAALLEQTAENLDRLAGVIGRLEEGRGKEREVFAGIARGLERADANHEQGVRELKNELRILGRIIAAAAGEDAERVRRRAHEDEIR
jgi:hypothetical protein